MTAKGEAVVGCHSLCSFPRTTSGSSGQQRCHPANATRGGEPVGVRSPLAAATPGPLVLAPQMLLQRECKELPVTTALR